MTRYFLPFLFTFLIGGQLVAQENPQLDSATTLQEVIITYQADKLTPLTYQNIDSKELKTKSTGQEPSFLLIETPSITNYSDAGSSQGYSYFRLRGVDQTRINITLDGVPLNEPEDQGAYFSNYPDIFNSVSKIQIQRGVGTSKNGIASYAGSVQLFSPNLYDSTKTTFGLGYGSFNSFRAFGEYNSGIKNKKAIYVRASQVYSDGYKYNSSNNSQSLFLSSGLFLDKSTWKFNLLAGQQKNELAWLGVSDSLISIDRRTNVNENERDRFFQSLAQIQNNWMISDFSSLQSSIYYTYLKGNYDFNLNSFLGLPSTEELYNYAFQSNLIGFFSNYTFSKNRLNWTTGIHGNVYDRKHTGSEKALGNLYENTGYKNEVSIFTKADYTINNLSFFADIQYRYSSFDYKGSVSFDKMDWNFINPKVGVSLEAKPNTVLYYSVGSTGREPTRNDIFGGNDDLLADSLGNALTFIQDPEYVVDHELGLRYSSSKFHVNTNLYYMNFRNEIVLQGNFGPNGLALTNNVEQSYRTGVELTIDYKINNRISLINNSSFNYSRIKEQSEVFSPILTPPLIINQEVVYSINGFSISLLARYQDKSYIDFANSSAIDGYFLLNGKVQYDFKGYTFSVFANNITNTKYFNQGYVDFDGSKKYFTQAPTNFYASVTYSF
ncbi:TonB-dependent receptor [Flammeovirgaceae bacterium SG7u.111]|nr:TonB-dependent receptor [Flammeovirgaceae bacterium SG7u.132]WPO37146.1 TonB-dependent receptor [Flammeovirgaceae bacterium SG7u.111]